MFEMTESNINDIQSLNLELLKNPKVGGICYFQGVVRNHNDGKEVESLEYQSYLQMANKIGNQIIQEGIKKFSASDAFCIHRTGHLQINDTAVWVIVTSDHRKEAFDACQYIIDNIKTEVPIWKKEYYKTGEQQWVACHRCLEHGHQHDK